jgi:hypothetical protein
MSANALLTIPHQLPSTGATQRTISVAVPAGTTHLAIFGSGTFDITAATFNTTETLSKLLGSAGSSFISMWLLEAPSVVTANLVVDMTFGRGGITVVCVGGAVPGAPTTANNYTSSNPHSLNISSTVDSLVLGQWGCTHGDSTTGVLSAGTELANYIGSAGAIGASYRIGVSAQVGTGAVVNATWTRTGVGAGDRQIAANFAALPVGPDITLQPTNQAALLSNGGQATFTAAATASVGNVTNIVVKKDGAVISNNSNFAITTTGVGSSPNATCQLVVTVTDSAFDQDVFTIEFTDANGTVVSNGATLSIFNGVTRLSLTGNVAVFKSDFDSEVLPGSFIRVRATKGSGTSYGSFLTT